MNVHWIRVGQWLLAKTPVHGPRVYRIPTTEEEARILHDPWVPTDFELWGGHPNEIMADHVGKKPKTPGDLAGLARPRDLTLSTWVPNDQDDPGDAPSEAWVPVTPTWTLPKTRDPYTFSTRELVSRYHDTKGEATIICGYCEAKRKSRDVRKLLKWFRLHPCISPYAVASRD
jgi:hypothetical protein